MDWKWEERDGVVRFPREGGQGAENPRKRDRRNDSPHMRGVTVSMFVPVVNVGIVRMAVSQFIVMVRM